VTGAFGVGAAPVLLGPEPVVDPGPADVPVVDVLLALGVEEGRLVDDVESPVLVPGPVVGSEPVGAVAEPGRKPGPTPVSASKLEPPLGFGPGAVVPEPLEEDGAAAEWSRARVGPTVARAVPVGCAGAELGAGRLVA
jgi:hypothetical protein